MARDRGTGLDVLRDIQEVTARPELQQELCLRSTQAKLLPFCFPKHYKAFKNSPGIQTVVFCLPLQPSCPLCFKCTLNSVPEMLTLLFLLPAGSPHNNAAPAAKRARVNKTTYIPPGLAFADN